ncbi:MAG: hypothetical protein K6C08_13550 [Oscillospiraceae bacterium]|nr:hypothetical protein [Oscillospiraceae bacterium]
MENTVKGARLLDDTELETVAGGVAGVSVASGSFTSHTGTSLELIVDWRIEEDMGSRTLYVSTSTASNALFSAALSNAVSLSLNGNTYYSDSAPVSYGGNARITSPLANFVIRNYPGGVSQMNVNWTFNGVIGGVNLGVVSASSTISS